MATVVEHDAVFINRLLDVIEHEIVPKTAAGVKVQGNRQTFRV
jgi:hypothetical protein